MSQVASAPMRFRLLPLFMIVVLALSATAAGAESDGEETIAGEVVVRVGLHADEKNFNPFLEPRAQPLTHDLTMLVYDTLFWSQSKLTPEPWLATGAEASADFRTWTVSLRNDVLWHDGEAFTADDVAFTFQYFSDDAGPGRYGPHVYRHPVFQSATVLDETTVELTFANPVATFEQLPGGDLPMLPQHLWEGIADPRADATSLPIGTGPFRMVDYQPDTSYRLEANQDYFLEAPLVDTLVMSVIPDEQQAFAALDAGELDFVARSVPLNLTEQLAANAELEIVGGSRLQSVYLQFDVADPVLASQQVRQALGLALDVDVILDVVEGGGGRLGTDTWTHPNSPWTRDPTGAHLSDQLAAGQLLDAAGYPSGADGGRVGPDGQPMSLTLGLDESEPDHVRTAELVVEQLGAVGVPVSTVAIDPRSLIGPEPPAVDMVVGEAEAHSHDDPDHLFFLFHSSSARFGSYANPSFDALVEDALDEPAEADSRLALVNNAQDILAQDLPAIVLYYPAARLAYRPAAYDGWTSDEGHGVFTKRSFLLAYADLDEDSRDGPPPSVPAYQAEGEGEAATDDEGGLGWLPIAALGIAAIAGAGALGLVLRRGRDNDALTKEFDEELDEEWAE